MVNACRLLRCRASPSVRASRSRIRPSPAAARHALCVPSMRRGTNVATVEAARLCPQCGCYVRAPCITSRQRASRVVAGPPAIIGRSANFVTDDQTVGAPIGRPRIALPLFVRSPPVYLAESPEVAVRIPQVLGGTDECTRRSSLIQFPVPDGGRGAQCVLDDQDYSLRPDGEGGDPLPHHFEGQSFSYPGAIVG
jgi:hypothetical protein